jgi:hypothetical protein
MSLSKTQKENLKRAMKSLREEIDKTKEDYYDPTGLDDNLDAILTDLEEVLDEREEPVQ